jgi:hypothetical protein
MVNPESPAEVETPKHNINGGLGAALFGTLVFGCLIGLPPIMWYILLPSIVGYIVACKIK